MSSLREVRAPIFKAGAPVADTDLFALVGGAMLRQQLTGASKFVVSILLQGAADLKLKIKNRDSADTVVTVVKSVLANTLTEIPFRVNSKFEYNLQLSAGVAIDLLTVDEDKDD